MESTAIDLSDDESTPTRIATPSDPTRAEIASRELALAVTLLRHLSPDEIEAALAEYRKTHAAQPVRVVIHVVENLAEVDTDAGENAEFGAVYNTYEISPSVTMGDLAPKIIHDAGNAGWFAFPWWEERRVTLYIMPTMDVTAAENYESVGIKFWERGEFVQGAHVRVLSFLGRAL